MRYSLHLHLNVSFIGLDLVIDRNESHDEVCEAEVVLDIRVLDSRTVDIDFKLSLMGHGELIISLAERLNCFGEVHLDKRVAEQLLAQLHQ